MRLCCSFQLSLAKPVHQFICFSPHLTNSAANPSLLFSHSNTAKILGEARALRLNKRRPGPLAPAPARSEYLPSVESALFDERVRSAAFQVKRDLLSREDEYRLGATIRGGTGLIKAKAELAEALGRPPTTKELAKELKMSSPAVRRMLADYTSAKSILVQKNMGLVYAEAKREHSLLVRRQKKRGLDELVQEGSIGLIRAAELFDPERGLRFSTYATVWIKGKLQNARGTTDGNVFSVPMQHRVKAGKVKAAASKYFAQHGESPSHEDLASLTSLSLAEVKDVLDVNSYIGSTPHSLSLDVEFSDTASSDEVDLMDSVMFKSDLLIHLTNSVTTRERKLLKLYYGLGGNEPMTLIKCAEELGFSKQYAQKLHKRTLEQLRSASSADSLREYLLTVA